MHTEERPLAEAAASLTVKDLEWVQGHRMMPQEPTPSEKAPLSHQTVSDQEDPSQEESSQTADAAPEKKTRKRVPHEWPEVRTILEADYHGQHYEAEVIEAPRCKSGKAVRIITGAATGNVCRSMSAAMLEATHAQREQQSLGKSGVANGWEFWKGKVS